MMIVIASLAVAIVCFILYALDRKSKGEPIAWDTAGKMSIFGGLLTSGVIFATSGEIPQVAETVKAVAETVTSPEAQEMFVGVPSF